MSLILKKRTVTTITKDTYVAKPFNPNFDGNLLAWYDGDTLTTDPANTWSDRSGNGYNLTLFNAPTIVNNAINSHDALQFDGVNQYTQRNITPNQVQPYSNYLVFKQITAVNGAILWSSGNTTFIQSNSAPNINMYNGLGINSNPDMVVNNYNIMTTIANGINSEIRTLLNVSVIGNAGGNGLTGLSQFASKYLGIERKVNNEKNTIIWAINTRYIDINVEL